MVRKYTNAEEKECIDEAIGDLSNAGWVLTTRSLNKAAFTVSKHPTPEMG